MASLIKSREHDKKLPDPITGEKKSTITHSFVEGINLTDIKMLEMNNFICKVFAIMIMMIN